MYSGFGSFRSGIVCSSIKRQALSPAVSQGKAPGWLEHCDKDAFGNFNDLSFEFYNMGQFLPENILSVLIHILVHAYNGSKRADADVKVATCTRVCVRFTSRINNTSTRS